MIKGDALCSTGLSKEIWDKLESNGEPWAKMENESEENYGVRKQHLQNMIFAICTVIDHIQTNAQVSTSGATGATGAAACSYAGAHPPLSVTSSGTIV